MNIKEYWLDIDSRLEQLNEKGYVKLPSLNFCDLDNFSNKISSEMGSLTFKELCSAHKNFLELLQIEKYLSPKLYAIAKDKYKFTGDLHDQYHIARKVDPGNSKEQYRAHFDSHLFTMVLPIKIPNSLDNKTIGELIYFANIRNMPKNELTNFMGKVFFKKNSSKKGLEILAKKYNQKVDDFKNYQPLLFLGKTTLHTNLPVSYDCNSYRLTLLAHFFDDSPKYGIGKILRYLRNR